MLFAAFGLCTDQLAKGAWGLVQNRYAGPAQQTVEIHGGARCVVRHNNQTAAIQKRSPDFPYRKIKRIGVEQRPDIGCCKGKPGASGSEKVRDTPVLDHDAFWGAC